MKEVFIEERKETGEKIISRAMDEFKQTFGKEVYRITTGYDDTDLDTI